MLAAALAAPASPARAEEAAAPGSTPPPAPPANRIALLSGAITRDEAVTLTVRLFAPGQLTGSVTFVRATHVRTPGGGTRTTHITATYARTTATLAAAGTTTIAMKPSHRTLRELAHTRRTPLQVKLSFLPTGGTAGTLGFKLTLLRSRSGRFS